MLAALKDYENEIKTIEQERLDHACRELKSARRLHTWEALVVRLSPFLVTIIAAGVMTWAAVFDQPVKVSVVTFIGLVGYLIGVSLWSQERSREIADRLTTAEEWAATGRFETYWQTQWAKEQRYLNAQWQEQIQNLRSAESIQVRAAFDLIVGRG